MLKLRTILFYNYFYYILIGLVLISVGIRVNVSRESCYQGDEHYFEGIITKYNVDGNKLTIWLKSKETLIGNYYFQEKKEKENFLKKEPLGKKIIIDGQLKEVDESRTKNLFNYKKYLNRQGIYYLLEIKQYKIMKKNNFKFLLKRLIKKRIKDNPYLNTFILGDKSYIGKEVIRSYQENGISHLFAISGMHISLLSSILLKILKKMKVKENKAYFIVSIFLGIYLFTAAFSASIFRGVLFFILFSINKRYYFYIKPLNIFLLTISITLLINPFFIYDTGFLYSFTISFYLLFLREKLEDKNYFKNLIKISLVAFIGSLPITLYNFYQINLGSIIYNLFFVPLISLIIFPCSLIVFILPQLQCIFNILIFLLEKTSLFFSKINLGKISFYRVSGIYYILYSIIIFLLFLIVKKKNNYKLFLILISLLIGHKALPYIRNDVYLKMIDVGQGDSLLLYSKGEAILVDTGGIKTFARDDWQERKNNYSIVLSKTIFLLRSLGIDKIKSLIISHGDYDHIGEAKELIDNFRVNKVIINNNKVNYYEKEICERTKCLKGKVGLLLNCGQIELLQLNKNLNDENDSSLVFLGVYKQRSFLLMGDASKKTEEELLKNYEIKNIDILKVGHHGSRTSSSEEFLKKIKPKVSLISAGVDNKFLHPHEDVVKRLKRYGKVYSTKDLGTITVNLKKLQIKNDLETD